MVSVDKSRKRNSSGGGRVSRNNNNKLANHSLPAKLLLTSPTKSTDSIGDRVKAFDRINRGVNDKYDGEFERLLTPVKRSSNIDENSPLVQSAAAASATKTISAKMPAKRARTSTSSSAKKTKSPPVKTSNMSTTPNSSNSLDIAGMKLKLITKAVPDSPLVTVPESVNGRKSASKTPTPKTVNSKATPSSSNRSRSNTPISSIQTRSRSSAAKGDVSTTTPITATVPKKAASSAKSSEVPKPPRNRSTAKKSFTTTKSTPKASTSKVDVEQKISPKKKLNFDDSAKIVASPKKAKLTTTIEPVLDSSFTHLKSPTKSINIVTPSKSPLIASPHKSPLNNSSPKLNGHSTKSSAKTKSPLFAEMTDSDEFENLMKVTDADEPMDSAPSTQSSIMGIPLDFQHKLKEKITSGATKSPKKKPVANGNQLERMDVQVLDLNHHSPPLMNYADNQMVVYQAPNIESIQAKRHLKQAIFNLEYQKNALQSYFQTITTHPEYAQHELTKVENDFRTFPYLNIFTPVIRFDQYGEAIFEYVNAPEPYDMRWKYVDNEILVTSRACFDLLCSLRQ